MMIALSPSDASRVLKELGTPITIGSSAAWEPAEKMRQPTKADTTIAQTFQRMFSSLSWDNMLLLEPMA
jgi:hypothetical protein